MMPFFLSTAALLGLAAVILGALGSHYLQLGSSAHAFSTAVYYQFFHALLMIALASLVPTQLSKTQYFVASSLFSLGAILFSGSIYLLTVFKFSSIGFVTPIGGLLLMIGWASLVTFFLIK